MLTEASHPHIDLEWLHEAGHSGLLIAVLGDVGEHDKPALTRMRHSAASAMAVALDVPAWARGRRHPGALGTAQQTAWLGAHGWRAVAGGPQDPVPAVWQELGLASRSGNARGRTAPAAPTAGSAVVSRLAATAVPPPGCPRCSPR